MRFHSMTNGRTDWLLDMVHISRHCAQVMAHTLGGLQHVPLAYAMMQGRRRTQASQQTGRREGVDFIALMDQVIALLRQRGCLTYRMLQRQWQLDDDALSDLKAALLYAHPEVRDDAARGLVWTPAAPVVAADAAGRFDAVLAAVTALLRCEGRVTYRRLMLACGLDAAFLMAVCHELTFTQVAHEAHGEGLVWTGDALVPRPHAFPSARQPALPDAAGLPVAASPAQSTPVLPPAVIGDPQDGGCLPAPARPAPEAERRQLSVLFCDLVGSTQLSSQLDPEDLRAVVRAYQETAAAVIQSYEGHIAQYLGDGLLVYCGYPTAHEDDARRAVHIGLGIVEAIAALNTRLTAQYGVHLAVRVGIHTGPVVVGQMGGGGRHEHLALGETVNIAARLEGLASANAVVISAVTARLLSGTFALDDLGTHTLHGVAEPLAVSRVRGLLARPGRDDEFVAAHAPLLVGREEESGLLRRRWEQSKAGLGQVVLISGEAGIGKSALVEGLRVQGRAEGLPRITYRCSPYHTTSPLYPVITHIEHLLQFEPDDAPATRLTKLEAGLQAAGLPLGEVVALLAGLLAIPLPAARYAPLTVTPQHQKQQTLDALVAWLVAEAERQPVLVAWEDLHWADPSTLELLELVIAQTPMVPMLHVLTYRPAFSPPWPPSSHITPLVLNSLERPQVEALIARRASHKTLPAEVVQHIVTKTDGVPLYVEELTRMLLASPLLREEADQYVLTGPLRTVAIPDTLQDALMARLDQLNRAKELAQLGAVLGREFAYELLQAIAPQDEAILQEGLAQLVAAELLYQRGRPPRARYIFKHALIQDAAYASLLKSTRQQVHQHVAQVLEARFPALVETQPELVAQHYTAAGCAEQAVASWQQAGQQALQRSASLEAVSHLNTALEVLATLPETPMRAQRELDLQIALGPALSTTRGQAALEVEQTYARARVLCQQIDDTPQLFPTLWGLCRVYRNRGVLPAARDWGEQLVRLSERTADATHRLEAHEALGHTLFHLGDYVTARNHLELALARTNPATQWPLALQHGVALEVQGLGVLANTLWCLGALDQAEARSQESLALAQELAHPYSIVLARYFAALLHYRRRDVLAVQTQADALLDLATAQGFPYYVGHGNCWRGWVLTMQGESAAGLAHLCQCLNVMTTLEAETARVTCLIVGAEAAGHAGQVEEGLRLLTEALTVCEANVHGDFLAEAHRLRGLLLLRQPGTPPAEAEACFQQALDVARRQEAKSLELRAAMSLARLWQQQGKQAEARALLAPVYDWFTEGFDTADLQEARALLDTLGA